MTVKYYAILTNQGAARLANATMLGSKLNLTQMAVGDANGVLPTPDPAQTKLINQKRIAPLNLLSVDPNNQSQIIAEQIIPENEGGFWIREIGLYDDEGVLIAVANCPETYKPQLQEGSGRTQTIRMILVVSNTEAITLKIDPSVVLATRKYVDDEVLELRLYVDDQMRNHIAAQDPHTQYAQKHNPTFTGEPKAPTPAAGNNTTRIATTAFVQAAITALINGAPATLDTLKEIAAAINNDPKFSTTINNALSGKQPLDETLTHLSGKDVAGLLAYLGLGEGSALPVGVPVPWPSATPPTGWLKCNGAAFSAEEYPELAKAYPTNKLPDLRGEFIRGWDDGRGVDVGRAILSSQGDAIRNIIGKFGNTQLYPSIYCDGAFGVTVENVSQTLGLTLAPSGTGNGTVNFSFDASKIVPVATENRPRNVAFNFIVRAA
ncbi:phage tail protein [Escherichia coli]|uniref:phage tail protein n=1 Tax=Escherichia coli TaxID=562 RepID=UPI0010EB9151|nr:phage tail protein [Escherichia coli]EFJ9995294.1 phage tail protein [Escherichia coli]EFO0972706.1 phage tail protein [Escherichia coli]EFO4731365.1 phage tail protein [Escherichia coli]GDW50068.1 phage variable tail fiber protein [Escherichia coli]HEG0045255.1 phage tail protein [Escherichia coli]